MFRILALSLVAVLLRADLRNLKGECFRYGKSYYLVANNSRHQMPDRYTVETYCDSFSGLIKTMNDSLFAHTTDGQGVSTLWDHHPNAKMISLAANESFIYELVALLPFLNPSILYRRRHKDWVVSWRLPDQHSFRVLLIPAGNKTCFSSGLNDDSVGWLRQNAALMAAANPAYAHIDLKGEDPRLFQMEDGSVLVSFARRFQQLPEIRMAHAQLYFHDMDDNSRINMDDIVDLAIEDKVEQFHDQKNWTPFEYKGELYYVNSIWPFQVVNITVDSKKAWMGLATMLTNVAFHNLKTHWEYGHIRGGTPALHIGNDTYFSFFHSSTTTRHLQTYCFGAFTFEVRSTPSVQFKLTGMSREPVVNSSMYSGLWKEQMGAFAFIDYVTFPMSFFVEDGFVFLLYGWQDKEGVLAKLKLVDLLASLVEIK